MSKSSGDPDITDALLGSGCIQVKESEEYRFVSGLTSPIYVDLRKLISLKTERKLIVDELLATTVRCFEDTEAIVGVATAGVPWGAWLAWKLAVPFAYVRPAPKDRGLAKQVEGGLAKGTRCLILEDLVTTGGSTERSAHVLRAEGLQTTGALSIFSYELLFAIDRFERLGLRHESLVGIASVISRGSKQFTAAQDGALQHWRTKTIPDFMFSNRQMLLSHEPS